MAAWYRVGTVNVTYDSPTVTGDLTAFTMQAKEGDTFLGPDGREYEIAADPTDNQTLTLRTHYRGPTLTEQPYAIKRYSDGWSVVAALALRIANFLQSVVAVLSGVGAPSNTFGADGSLYFDLDPNNPRLRKKSSGVWDAGIDLRGPQGPAGPGFATTSTSTITVGTGTAVFAVPDSGTAYQGARVRAAKTSDATIFLEGSCIASTATTITLDVDLTDGSGTHSDWNIVPTGVPGSPGPAGAPSTGVSSTPNAIATGPKTWSVPSGLDLVAGQRVRFADQAAPDANWMEGPITNYAAGSMTVGVDTILGSGTKNAWNFGIIGSRGLQGLPGNAGAPSTVPGPSYNATSTSSLAIGTGTKVAAIGTGYAYLPGARVRLASNANPATHYMEGEVTGYSTGNLTVAVDKLGTGTGTYADWNLSIAGDPGSPGTPGTNGLSFTHRGDYDNGTTYSKNDVVLSGGSTWAYINNTPAAGEALPVLPTTSNTYWQLFAQKGTDGAGTVNSVNGLTGAVVIDTPTMQVFTATGTWTRPTGCRKIKVTAVGGGGGGGGGDGATSNVGTGGGGGGGGVSVAFVDVTSVSAVAVTVGAGGGGGLGTAAGGAGGTSSFGTYATGSGGGGGQGGPAGTALNAYAGGAGGIGSVGDLNYGGGPGLTSTRFSSTLGMSGAGGSGPFGGGGQAIAADSNGLAGTGFGAGGGGATAKTSVNRTGGSGSAGVVFVEEFY